MTTAQSYKIDERGCLYLMDEIPVNSIDEELIIKIYEDRRYTLRHLANIFGTNHHMIKRILIKHGIHISRRNSLKTFTEEHKKKISITRKRMYASGELVSWNKGLKSPNNVNLKNMVAHLHNNISIEQLEKYDNFEKLKFLNRAISRHRKHFDSKKYIKYLDKFYYDITFNELYEKWIKMDKNKWYMPSIDHKTSKSNGGNFDLENIHFMTWFENRAKAEMNINEWNTFKCETKTRSDLFND